jgi:hypothetical protein
MIEADRRYAASSDEPLLQIADLLAFCIERLTYR